MLNPRPQVLHCHRLESAVATVNPVQVSGSSVWAGGQGIEGSSMLCPRGVGGCASSSMLGACAPINFLRQLGGAVGSAWRRGPHSTP